MALSLLLKYPQDIQILKASFDHFRVTNSFLEDVAEAINHAPDQAWGLEDVEKGDKLAAHELE